MEKYSSQPVTIVSGGTDSDPIRIGNHAQQFGLLTPSAFTGASFTIHGSLTEGGTYVPIEDQDGNAVLVTFTADTAIGFGGADLDAVLSWPYVKIVSASNEGADRDFTAVVR